MFKNKIKREKINSWKWKIDKNEIPMTVAVMDFKTAPLIKKAMKRRISLDNYGYSYVPDSFYESVQKWWSKRHQWNFEKKEILFCAGVIPTLSSTIRKLVKDGENIVVLTPVYYIFFNSIINNNKVPLPSDLVYKEGKYEIDFEDLEKKLANNKTTMLIMCNPHNPIGKVWDKETLKKVGDLCLKYNVLIISDEIHCDLTYSIKYTPMASISDEIANITITCVSMSKAFNLAGIQSSAIIIKNEEIRKKVDRAINTDEVAYPNIIATQAFEAATASEKWLNNTLKALERNKNYLIKEISENAPYIKVVDCDSTYLMWLDCSKICNDTSELCDFIRKYSGLILTKGKEFKGNGEKFIRWNFACPKSMLNLALKRFFTSLDRITEVK
ncbi:cystathione beta-lyase [Spiroplasma helicoides]|uniref:cysteine-S-conjugate beta-lyase n=1 Tax=Spiroplasma helicoides TaxID=216938 RepID=A0A1B3SKR0_9MOLU|nr:PatB family C-S lyase [Spiroplasma helicoides]AOG60507.1 cystathione beta-lyase [Spiroplasma helicoides]